MSSAFKDLDEENLKLMEASLMENIDKVTNARPFITLYYWYTGMDRIISNPCYKAWTILQRNDRKMTILWSFSYNSFVKFQD